MRDVPNASHDVPDLFDDLHDVTADVADLIRDVRDPTQDVRNPIEDARDVRREVIDRIARTIARKRPVPAAGFACRAPLQQGGSGAMRIFPGFVDARRHGGGAHPSLAIACARPCRVVPIRAMSESFARNRRDM